MALSRYAIMRMVLAYPIGEARATRKVIMVYANGARILYQVFGTRGTRSNKERFHVNESRKCLLVADRNKQGCRP